MITIIQVGRNGSPATETLSMQSFVTRAATYRFGIELSETTPRMIITLLGGICFPAGARSGTSAAPFAVLSPQGNRLTGNRSGSPLSSDDLP